jgi:hypothetical protein
VIWDPQTAIFYIIIVFAMTMSMDETIMIKLPPVTTKILGRKIVFKLFKFAF